MPTYTFTSKSGERIELTMSVAEYERVVKDGTIIENGVRYERDLMADLPGGAHPGKWPMMSDAMGVHPSQIQEARDYAAAMGVNTEYAADGRPILRDRAHRRAHMRAMGFRDNDGGYGD